MQKRSFGRTKEGREVTEYTLVNAQGMTLSVIDLGATIVSITMKGSDGNIYDVVLGYDTPVDYQNNTCYFGSGDRAQCEPDRSCTHPSGRKRLFAGSE